MNSQDFNKLQGLLSKLETATKKASFTDKCFQKYHKNSIEAMKSPYSCQIFWNHGVVKSDDINSMF